MVPNILLVGFDHDLSSSVFVFNYVSHPKNLSTKLMMRKIMYYWFPSMWLNEK